MSEPKATINMAERKWPCPRKEWDDTGGINVYGGVMYYLFKHYPDLHRDVSRQIAFAAGHKAHKWRDEYIDNIRVMRVKEPTDMYFKQFKNGCCGESDIVVITSGPFRSGDDETEMWLVGWNHGH